MKISIALVEPKLAINVGYIARLMKNFGLKKLLLITPNFDTNEAKVFATHGKNLLERAEIIDFAELRKFDLLIGTTAMRAKSRLNIIRDSITLERLVSILQNNSKACIVLGRESTGLTNRELSYCDLVVNIETLTDYKTLNISHALAIILYEILAKGRSRKAVASKSERELLIAYALGLAEKSDYPKHKEEMLQTTLKRLLASSSPTSKEVMLLTSLIRDAILAIDRSLKGTVSADTKFY
ncbi:MAG: RNA methyltransferase [Nitrososphaerales archaeon]